MDADATAWSDVVSDALVAADFSFSRPERFRGRVTTRRLGPTSLIAMVAHPHVAVRAREHIAAHASAETLLSLQLEGGAEFRQDGRTAIVGPGDLVFYDSARPVEIVAAAGYRSLCFRFPTTGPGAHRRPDPLTATTLRGAHGLAPAVAGLLTGLQSSTGAGAGLAAQQAVELARTLFDDELGRRGLLVPDDPHEGLRAAFDEHVEAHLAEVDLTPRSAAAALFVSPRHLHAVLAEAGRTPAGTIRTRRLERCLADLADPAEAATPVSSIARRWGFPNATRFGQLVRRHTGRTPTAYRRAMLA
ncbi:helix-turn-helix domain-containing protein [Actinomycetospora termitidis]|uniref:Helix-turn-helix domain-containing protein n=1 Tax=Actinomycetospora termitidis TaxID=3053470 RepID=A0ABT7MIN0_9PSEU|nr:helix-turn-helix domain-containing protein [Actinomycetospora sp. Odt1-22]MDL5160536.1 helix-turn-helix domain-containing protein [Actinomycetospora sp. Odt1-22]